MTHSNNSGPPRTLLEQLIRERNQTLEEFTESAETYAREHGEPGTLSLRHLQRLITGKRPDGRPLGALRPATARLLERMLGEPIDRLIDQPHHTKSPDVEADELRRRIFATRRVDNSLIVHLHTQLDATRRLDRELGAVVAHDEVIVKLYQVQKLLSYSLMPQIRQRLAALLSELGTLAGWQALDLGRTSTAWEHYQIAQTAASVSESSIYEAHAAAEQAFVLIDIGEHRAAVNLAYMACHQAREGSPPLLQAWLAAARGETLAALTQRDDSLRAYDVAAKYVATGSDSAHGPYIALDNVHLARWRGHALARLGDPSALDVLRDAASKLDSTFSRAEAAIHVDLATAYAFRDEVDTAQVHLQHARSIADQICSTRQRRRAEALALRLT